MNTIVSVLSSSITCKALRFEKEEIWQIGSSISRHDCLEMIQVFNDVVSKLDKHGEVFNLFKF